MLERIETMLLHSAQLANPRESTFDDPGVVVAEVLASEAAEETVIHTRGILEARYVDAELKMTMLPY